MGGQGLGGSPNLIFRAIGCRPLGGEYGVFSINSARSSLIASVDLHATFVGGKFLLINIFVHVSFGTFPRIKLNYYFYVSEPSPSDCQRPGIA